MSYLSHFTQTKHSIIYGVQFQADRVGVAAPLARGGHLQRRGRRVAPQVLCSGHVSLSVGCGAACRSSARLYRIRHLFALQTTVGLQRAAPYGLRRIRPAGRAVCHTDRPAPRPDHRAEHSPLPRAARQDRFQLRLAPRGAHVRSRVLPLDAVGLCRDVRPLLRQHGAACRAYREARCAFGGARHRGARCGADGGTLVHGGRVGGYG
ncbi:hypothetical protein IMSAGC022_00552 [Alistipes sp.]|nr:hypothetical protein IMSAGC022_00552 [Alistipes sp.]